MKRAEPGWLVLALAGIAAGIGSLLPFYTFGGGIDLTVWNRSLFPTATLIPAFLLGIGIEAMFVLLMGYEPRSPFLNFTWSQARLAGSAFAIVLALGYLVQGRAGGSLGSGYIILSLSTVASFAGAVMTRRAELGRGHEEIVKTEHPWRAAVLRWRRELAAKVQNYASGSSAAPSVQPVSDGPSTEKAADGNGDMAAVAKPEEPSPAPTPVVRLSAVQSKPEPDTGEQTGDKAEEKNGDEAEEETGGKAEEKAKTDEKPAKARRKPAKAAATKTLPQESDDTGDEAAPGSDGDTPPTEPKPVEASDAESNDSDAKADPETADEQDDERDDERQRPAAPG